MHNLIKFFCFLTGLVLVGAGCASLLDAHDFHQDIAHLDSEALQLVPNLPSEIPVSEVVDAESGYDEIQSIDDPIFESVDSASSWLDPDGLGILVTIGETTRYYPFQIMESHEVVNDTIDGVPILVTYCAICRTGVVFERMINGEAFEFGVSGKLYENNLLMYNRNGGPSSLWSQAYGRAVLGALAGTELNIMPQLHMKAWELVKQYQGNQHVVVLSRDAPSP